MSKLRIVETFFSIQGEGTLVGTPSYFIRVSGCNLRCVWCDTPYASWHPEGPVQTLDEILSDVDRVAPTHVVLTGGEPMLFDAVGELCNGLKEREIHITIETAGTIDRDWPIDLLSVSPKMKNSTPTGDAWEDRHEQTRLDRGPLKSLIGKYPVQIKFVIAFESMEQDLREVEDLLVDLPAVKPEQILLMPEGTDAQRILVGMRALVPISLEKKWRISPRLHVELFGNTKGT